MISLMIKGPCMREVLPLDDFLDTLLADEPKLGHLGRLPAHSAVELVEEQGSSPLETLFLNALHRYPELAEPVLPEFGELASADITARAVPQVVAPVVPEMQEQNSSVNTSQSTILDSDYTPTVTEYGYLHERVARSFQSIVCVINGTQIALPLAELGGIHQISKIERIAGKAQWCLGVMDIKGTNYNIVDGSRWLIDPNGRIADEVQSPYQYVILLNDSNWGIACHDLVDTVLCEKENIKWRDPSRSKPWLAGIIKEQMCILLDTFAVVDMVQQGLVSNQQ